jgi:hypothetical protein
MKVHTEGLLPVNCLLPASLLRQLDEAAKERQLTRTGLVRLLAADEVARQRAQRSDLQDNRSTAA